MFQDLYKLTKENNRMLKAIRRDAFVGGVIKLIITIAFIVVPLWLYQEYVAPQVERIMGAMEGVEQAGNSTMFQDFLKTFSGPKGE